MSMAVPMIRMIGGRDRDHGRDVRDRLGDGRAHGPDRVAACTVIMSIVVVATW